jgi:autophagy-related protein 16
MDYLRDCFEFFPLIVKELRFIYFPPFVALTDLPHLTFLCSI